MPITSKPEPDHILSTMREIAVSLKIQLEQAAKEKDDAMLLFYNNKEKFSYLLKTYNQMNLIFPLLSTVIFLSDEDDLPFESAWQMKAFSEKLSDREFFDVKKKLNKILELEMIRSPTLEIAFQQRENEMTAFKTLQIRKQKEAIRRAHERVYDRQQQLKEEKALEQLLESKPSRCIIC